MTPEEPIEKVEDAIDIIRGYQKRITKSSKDDSFVNYLSPDNFIYGLWFRGEKDFGLDGLTPSVFRQNGEKGMSETTIFHYLPTINNELRNLTNYFDRLTYMQHYEIPTRLLDWTDNILVALYFAVAYDNKDEVKDSNLFVLNARALNQLSSFKSAPGNIHIFNSYGTIFRMMQVYSESADELDEKIKSEYGSFDWKRDDMNREFYRLFNFPETQNDFNSIEKAKILSTPVAVRPNTVNNRLLFQNGLFTLHGGKIKNGKNHKSNPLPEPFTLFKVNEKTSQKVIECYRIPKEKKAEIKNDLLNLRIHEGSLFPELDKQANIVKLISE